MNSIKLLSFVFLTSCIPATVQVCSGDSCGTGYTVSDRIIQTAAHVVGESKNVVVYVPYSNYLGAYVTSGIVVSVDKTLDSAKILVKKNISKPVEKCIGRNGDRVKVYGQDGSGPTRSARTVRTCIITNTNKAGGNLDCALEPKMSGSPIVKRGCVIGWSVANWNSGSKYKTRTVHENKRKRKP